MNRHWIIATAATGLLTGSVWLSASGQSSTAQNAKPVGRSHERVASHESRGERVFKQNCARCHNAPQGFPQQISGTIIRHMRVRASLSAADEKALLEFMNP